MNHRSVLGPARQVQGVPSSPALRALRFRCTPTARALAARIRWAVAPFPRTGADGKADGCRRYDNAVDFLPDFRDYLEVEREPGMGNFVGR